MLFTAQRFCFFLLLVSLAFMRHSGAVAKESLLIPLRLYMSFSTTKSIFMKCALGLCLLMQQQAGENNAANCLASCLSHVRMFILQSSPTPSLVYFWPLGLEPLVLIGLKPLLQPLSLHASEDQSPPFVIGKHAEERVFVFHIAKRQGEKTDNTNISIFPKNMAPLGLSYLCPHMR